AMVLGLAAIAAGAFIAVRVLNPSPAPGAAATAPAAVVAAAPVLPASPTSPAAAPVAEVAANTPAPQALQPSGAGAAGPAAAGAEAPTPAAAPVAPAGSVPQRPSQGAVTGALGAVLPDARACLGPDDPVSKARVVFGSNGSVESITVTGFAAGKPVEACIKGA